MTNYKLTYEQKELLKKEMLDRETNVKEYIENILYNHILNEKGSYKNKKDYLSEEQQDKLQIEYILKSSSKEKTGQINKYNVSNYYYILAKHYNQIAKERKLCRNKLWEEIKKNILFKEFNTTELRLYKYIYRG